MTLFFPVAALTLGLITSLHCVGMCGPLALALPVVGKSRAGYIAGRLLYNLGRTVTYTVMGVIVGLASESFAIGGFQRGISISVGVMILIGLALVYSGVMPRIMETMGIWSVFAKIQKAWKVQFSNRRYTGLLSLGFINGLLPCGPVYVALAGAAVTGSAAGAGFFMFVFGLGTVPLVLVVSLSGKLIQLQLRRRLQRLVPASAAVVAVLLILRGMALGIPYISPPVEATSLEGSPRACCSINAIDEQLPIR